MKKKVVFKILAFLLLFCIINGIYVIFFLENDLIEHTSVIPLVNGINESAQIVSLNDKRMNPGKSQDVVERSLSQIIGTYYPALVSDEVQVPTSHPGWTKYLLNEIPDNYALKTLIIPLELASFSNDHASKINEDSWRKSVLLLQAYPAVINRLLLSFPAFLPKSRSEQQKEITSSYKNQTLHSIPALPYNNVYEWDRAMSIKGVRDENGEYLPDLTSLACHYIKTYAFEIDTQNNKTIRQLDEIVSMAEKRNWNLVFSLLPENVNELDKLVGKDLSTLVERNRDILIKYYSGKGIKFLDMLSLLKEVEFVRNYNVFQRYKQGAKIEMAKTIAMGISDIHPNDFEMPDANDFRMNSFIIDCEQNEKWKQSSTFSSIFARSGSYSSKVSKKDPYSVTFEYPLREIKAGKRNKISVDFYIKKTEDHLDPVLVLEFEPLDNKSEKYWKGINTSSILSANDNGWIHFNYEFNESKLLQQNAKIKIYLWHDQPQAIFVDDLSIVFD